MKSKNILKNIFIKESHFSKSIKLAKSNPNKIGLVVLFDILFLVSAYSVNRILWFFSQNIVINQPLLSIAAFISLSLFYYLIMLFVYSFFKYMILDYINSLLEKSQFSFNRLGKFYALNVTIAVIFFAIMILVNYILSSIQQQYRPFIFIFVAVPYLLFFYTIVNIAHSLFYQGNPILASLRKSVRITFTKIRVYRETILIMIIFALLLWLLFFGAGYLIRLVASKNYTAYLKAYAYYKQGIIIVFDLIFYFVILINRITFYSLTKENLAE